MKNHLTLVQPSKPTGASSPTRDEMMTLFDQLRFSFPGTFTAQFKTAADYEKGLNLWMRALHGLSQDDLDQGIIYCEKNAMTFFPTPAQFREFCYNAKKAEDGYYHANAGENERAKQNMKRQAPNARKLLELTIKLAKGKNECLKSSIVGG